LKNQSSRLTEHLRSLERDHCILLTGTPLQNKTEELWALLNFLSPQAFPGLPEFLERFGDLKDSTQVKRVKPISSSFIFSLLPHPLSSQVAELHEMLKPFLLRRVKEDVEKSLPPKEETIVEVELTSIQKKYYRAIYERNTTFLFRGSKPANAPSLMNVVMELRKCCNHPYLNRGVEDVITADCGTLDAVTKMRIDSSGKMLLLDKLLPKLKEGGHQVLVFSQMVRVLDIIADYLRCKRYLFERLDGSVRGNERQAAIDRFVKPEYQRFIMLLSTRAGGLGLNLTAADTVIIFDSDWNPQNDLQAQARAHRIGQTQSVKVYRLLTKKTYEMHMFHRASMKLGLDRAVLSHAKAEREKEAGGDSKGDDTWKGIPNAKEIDEVRRCTHSHSHTHTHNSHTHTIHSHTIHYTLHAHTSY
jgi:SNF2 family DNA or RNA helicase